MTHRDPHVREALLRDLNERARLRRVATAAVVLACLTVGIAAAAPPMTFSSGEELKSTKLNDNFREIDARLTTLETKKARATNPKTGRSVSIGATYCGATPSPVTGSAIGGYDKAAAACQAAVGCAGSATAHMCTSDEVVRSRMIGLEIPSTWYSTGSNGMSFYNTTEHALNDCAEWSTALPNQLGAQWNAGGSGGPGYAGCSSAAPIACCD